MKDHNRSSRSSHNNIWNNLQYYVAGANNTSRWCGDCPCGFATTSACFDDVETQLRTHIEECPIKAQGYRVSVRHDLGNPVEGGR